MSTGAGAVRELDGRSVDAVFDVLGPRAMSAAAALTDLGDPKQAVVLIAAVLAVAPIVVAPARVVVVAILLVGANAGGVLVAGCCDRVVDVPLTGAATLPVPASAPSNHTVLAASVGAAAVLVVPWPLVGVTTAAALVLTAAMAVSLLLQRSHVLTDVASGLLLVGAWVAVAMAVEPALRRRLPARAGPLPLRRGRTAALTASAVAVAWLLARRATGQVETVADAVAERPRPVLLGVALALLAGAALQVMVRPRAPGDRPPRA